MRTPEKANSIPDLANFSDGTPKCCVTARNKRKRTDSSSLQWEEVKDELKCEMKTLFMEFSQAQNDQSNSILTTLKDIQQTNSYVQSTITFLCEENVDLKKKIEQLQLQSQKDKEQIIMLENRLEEQLRTDRKANIEIKNVPLKGEEKKKDLIDMVLKLSENLEVKIQKSDFKDILKLNKTKNQQNSTIIVEFTNSFVKTDILRAAKNYNTKNRSSKLSAKHMGIKYNPDIPIYISENLTPKSSRLFFLARDLKITKNYKYCWSNFGKVYLRMDDNSPIISIHSEAQIQQLASK